MTETRSPRSLTVEDITRLVGAARRMGFPLGPIVETLALTAAPPRAVRFMRWADIDRAAATWTPRHQGDAPGPIPLVPDMQKLLDAVPQAGHRYVFAGRSGKAAADSARRRAVLARAAGLPDFELADIWHSLRAELRHPEKREVLESWSALIRDLLAPHGPAEMAPLRTLPEDAPKVDEDTGTLLRGGRSS